MNTALDFVRAAAPWVAAGLAVIIIAVRGVRKKKKGEKENGEANYGLEGMSLGMCIGLLAGTMLGDNNVGLGVSLGMLIGLVVGNCILKKTEYETE